MQRDIGLQSATDGEFRRSSWHMDFIYQLGGIEQVPGNITVKFRNPDGEIGFTPAAIHVAENDRLERPIFGAHFGFLREAQAEGVTPKLTIPSPSKVHYRASRAGIEPGG